MTEQELITALSKARGQQYTNLFRQADATIGERLRNEIRQRWPGEKFADNITIMDIGKLAVREGLSLKTLCRMIEDKGCLPAGYYELLIRRGVKPSYLLEKAREQMAAASALAEREGAAS